MPNSFGRGIRSFIIRLWHESTDGEEPTTWRGQIERVGSGEKAHFKDPNGLLDIVARWSPGFIPDDEENEKEER